jgi:hypothetical protein
LTPEKLARGWEKPWTGNAGRRRHSGGRECRDCHAVAGRACAGGCGFARPRRTCFWAMTVKRACVSRGDRGWRGGGSRRVSRAIATGVSACGRVSRAPRARGLDTPEPLGEDSRQWRGSRAFVSAAGWIGTYRAGLGGDLAGHARAGRDGERGESGDGVHRVFVCDRMTLRAERWHHLDKRKEKANEMGPTGYVTERHTR